MENYTQYKQIYLEISIKNKEKNAHMINYL